MGRQWQKGRQWQEVTIAAKVHSVPVPAVERILRTIC